MDRAQPFIDSLYWPELTSVPQKRMPAKEERHFLAMVEIINLNDQDVDWESYSPARPKRLRLLPLIS